MAKDLSRQTILALVVLTIAISLLGTFTVYNEVQNANVKANPSTATGQVKLSIGTQDNAKQIEPTSTEGELKITIIR